MKGKYSCLSALECLDYPEGCSTCKFRIEKQSLWQLQRKGELY